MSKISVRSVPEIRPEDRCYQVSGQESGWALDQFGSPATGEVYIVRHFVHESMIAPWTWWERIFAVNSFSRTLLTGLIENNPQYAFNIYEAAKERFSVTCSPLITEMREIDPLSEPILRLSQPLVSSIEIEENPMNQSQNS
jgi:hypothetical protein